MTCRLCGLNHPGWVNCKVAAKALASNSASNAVVAASNPHLTGDSLASNERTNAEPAAGQSFDDDPVSQKYGVEISKKQRWAKDKYNAYQREYMKVVRAVKAGKAMLIRRSDGHEEIWVVQGQV